MEEYLYDEDMEEVVLDDERGVTEGWFLRRMVEGEIIINIFYMIIGGIFT